MALCANNLGLHGLFHYTISSVESRLRACSWTRVASDNRADFSAESVVLLAGGAPVSQAASETGDKPRRPTHSAGASYHHAALKTPKPAGKYGNINIMKQTKGF